jgi:hypothetical protein
LRNIFTNGIYALKETWINDMIVRQIVNRSGFIRAGMLRKSCLGGVWVTYLKINFGLGSNAPQARPGEILKFQPVQTSTSWFHSSPDSSFIIVLLYQLKLHNISN